MNSPAEGDTADRRAAAQPSQPRRSRDPLEETPDIHRLLVESVRDYAIFVLDTVGHVRTWNPGARRLKGYTADEIVGRHFSVFYPEEDLARGKPAMELEVAAREGRFEDEGWRLRKDGERFWANVIITALRNDAGEVLGFAKVTRDLTDRRAAELKAIEDARKVAHAEAANRAKSELLAVLSHELRTPLTSIGAYVDVLALGIQGPLTDPQREALERIRQGHRHLSMLVTDLLNFGMVQAGRISFRIAQVRLADVAEAVRPLTDPLAHQRGVEVEWQEPDEAVVALGDVARLQQILVNLVTNAIKYNDPGGSVRVRHLVRDGKAVFEVTDTGPGIPAEQAEAIFEPFTQLGRSLTSTHEGTGLGLAISRQLARGMDGELGVRSAAGEGSTFVLSVPLAP